jgi:hypothetical protein
VFATTFLALGTTGIGAQKRPDPILSITEAELRDHIFYLASDFLEGRDAGTMGYDLAAEYAAVHLGQAGLQTMYTDSAGAPSFFQRINFVSKGISPETAVRVRVGGVEHAYRMADHFIAQEVLGRGNDRSVTESPVFLGYGIEEPELGWNDYEGMDVAGKIAVVVAGAPMRNGEPVLPEEQHQLYSNFQQSINVRLQAALSHEVTTLILILDPGSMSLWERAVSQSSNRSVRPESGGTEEAGPAPALSEFILMRPDAAVELLSGTGLDPLTGTGEYTTGPMEGVDLSFDLRHTEEPGYVSPNVVGFLPGSDPVLKDEYIVVTAHLDHVGIRSGQVYNGADDNASGSAAVLEAAEAVAMAQVRRSVIFVLLTAEEKGLLGAFHFADNPPVPAESIVLNINLDMVGRNSPEFPEALLALASEEGREDLVGMIREVNETQVGATLDWRLIEGEDPHGHVQRSDQLAFMQKGIPAILITRGFMGPDYHEPSDDPETINYDKVLQAAKLTFGLAVQAANRDERPGGGASGG